MLHCVKCGTLIRRDMYYFIDKCGFVCDTCKDKFFRNQKNVRRAVTLK